MIECPKCHRHISSMVKNCPECGAPVAQGQPTNEKEQPHQMGCRVQLLLAFFALIAVTFGVLLFYDYRAEKVREERAYARLQDCSNPAFYEDFIIRFPESEHIDEVRARYQTVAAQQGEWQELILNGSREDLEKFVTQHPTSPYVRLANTRIDSIDWAEAKQRRTLEAITHYMTLHADGYYIDEAESLRQSLERAQAEAAMLAAQRDSSATADTLQLQ